MSDVSMRVLVVEDDLAVREGLVDALEIEGFEVIAVPHGEAALSALEAGVRPDVVLLDLMMPVMSGPELRARLKRDPEFASLPVVVLSAVSELTLAQARADAAIAKPFELTELVATLRRVVAERGARARRGLSFVE